MSITSQPKRSFRTFAAVVPVLAALVVPAAASASDGKARGVRAEIESGTLSVQGSDRADTLALRLRAGDPSQIQVDVGADGSADFSFARSDVRAIEVATGNGDDSARIDDSNGAFTDAIPTIIAGGRGDDSLNGGLGAERFRGGNGDDTVVGGKGNDTGILGRGDDSFRWDPGDGSDVIEGQSGSDTMLFNGAPVSDTATLSANGGRLTFFRNPANITMDTDGVETVDFNALGGADSITVNDLTGTDVSQVNLDLAAALGGNAGDDVADSVVVNGTNGADTIHIDGTGSGADVTGLASAVSVKHADPDHSADPSDSLSVNTLTGADNVLATAVAGVLQVLVNGNPV